MNNNSVQTPIKKGLYSVFLDRMQNMPYWFVSGFMYEMKKKEDFLSGNNLYENIQQPFPIASVTLTFAGKKELQTKASRLSMDVYKFLHMGLNGCTLMEIAINNFWSFEKTSKIFSYCFQREFVARTADASLSIVASYLGGELKLGEYLKRLGIIETEDIQKALEEQKRTEQRCNRELIGSIFTKMGLVTMDDLYEILALKADTDKVVFLNFDIATKPLKEEFEKQKRIIAKLMAENKALKRNGNV